MRKIIVVISLLYFLLVTVKVAQGETAGLVSQAEEQPEVYYAVLPDSIVYRDTIGNYIEKHTYAYDDGGNKTSEIYYSWNRSANKWTLVHEYEYACDPSGNYTLYACYRQDSTTGVYAGIDKYEYNYDDNTNLTLYAAYRWNHGWEKHSQYEYTYDDNGNRTRYEHYSLNAGVWSGKTKYESLYDADNRLLQHISCLWDTVTGSWADVYKSLYSYNPDGRPNESVDYKRSFPSDTWVEHIKYKYSYNPAADTLYNYTWNLTANDWEYTHKYEFTADEHGDPLSYVSYTWDGSSGDWTANDKYEHAYPADHTRHSTGYVWDVLSGAWISRTKHTSVFDADDRLVSYADSLARHTYLYDERGNQTASASFVWDAATGEWKNRQRSDYAYDSRDNLTLLADYAWDAQANKWLGNDKYETDYDEAGHPLFVSGFVWDAEGDRWMGSYKLGYEYTGDGNLLQSSYYDWNATMSDWFAGTQYLYVYDEGHKRIAEENRYFRNIGADARVLYATGTYYYSDLSMNIQHVKAASIGIYPNPASKYITVSLPGHLVSGIEVRLFDMNGRIVLEQNDTLTNHPVLLRNVSPGMYIYRIKAGNQYYNGRLIVE